MDSIKDMNYELTYIHPEEEPNVDELNDTVTNIDKDLKYIDNTLIESAGLYKNLLETTKLKLTSIKELINLEKERQEDINILCNKFSDFSTVINLYEDSFEGELSFDNNILTAPIKKSDIISYKIEDISGNGQAGNSYVYQNGDFISNILDTSNTSNINDDNLATYYEYSRITMSDRNEDAPIVFNKDSLEAECTLLISSDDYINKIQVNSDRDDLILKEVYISNDGNTFKLDKEYNIQINKLQDKYSDQTYIYGSGIIVVPTCKYIKLCFKSNGYTDEDIAYIKVFNENTNITKKIQKVVSAKRHVIKLNEINLFKNVYTNGSSISKELINDPIKYISLYCNEYIDSNYTIEENIKYYFIINGEEFEIVPINSQRNGKKIVRTSSQTYKLDNTQYIDESIKSAKLKIVIDSANASITPFVSNIKILIGGYNE